MTRSRQTLLAFLAGLFALSFFLEARYPEAMARLCHEDGPVEWYQALFVAAASVLFVQGAMQRKLKNVWYWGYALMFFLNAGEEVSWGQRIFGITTPAKLKSVNVQQELNFHNIHGIHEHVRLVGLAVLFTFAVVIPLTQRYLPSLDALYLKLAMPVFPLWATPVVVMGALFMAIPRMHHLVSFNLDEMGELYTYIGFLIFGLSARMQAMVLPEADLSLAPPRQLPMPDRRIPVIHSVPEP